MSGETPPGPALLVDGPTRLAGADADHVGDVVVQVPQRRRAAEVAGPELGQEVGIGGAVVGYADHLELVGPGDVEVLDQLEDLSPEAAPTDDDQALSHPSTIAGRPPVPPIVRA